MNRAARPICLSTFGLLLSLAACTPSRMAVPADLAKEAEIVPVMNRSANPFGDEAFSFGPYKVSEVDRKWIPGGSSWSIGGVSWGKTTGGYKYKFASQTGEAKVECATELRKIPKPPFSMRRGPDSVSKLGCKCEGGGVDAQLTVEGNDSDAPTGQATIHGTALTVTGTKKIESGYILETLTGFEARGQAATGAVEVIHPGRVFLARSVEAGARSDLACLFAGLLLYRPEKTDK